MFLFQINKIMKNKRNIYFKALLMNNSAFFEMQTLLFKQLKYDSKVLKAF